MLAQYKETSTPASRVIYINSANATATFGGNRADFDFTLDEPVVVPPHHSILMSVFSAEIPYSFYNFQDGINTRLDYVVSTYGVPCLYDADGKIDMTQPGFVPLTIPEGNYTAVELAALLTSSIFWLEVLFDPIKLKFKFICTQPGNRVTLALRNGHFTGTPESPGDDMNEELGFDWYDIVGDPYVGLNVGSTAWESGACNGNPAGAGLGIDIPTPLSPFAAPVYLHAEDVCDMTNSVRSLFVRTNLSTTSVLDSNIGGGFSSILCRVPINAEPGGIINIQPVNGNVHKLLLKLKAITNISLRLTNQKNKTINLNGLDYDISLKLDFIEDKELPNPPSLRELIDNEKIAKHKVLQEQEKLKKKTTKKKKKKDTT